MTAKERAELRVRKAAKRWCHEVPGKPWDGEDDAMVTLALLLAVQEYAAAIVAEEQQRQGREEIEK